MKPLRQLMIVTALFCVMMVINAHDKQVVIPGNPPLTQDMVEDYARLLEWRMGLSTGMWNRDRLRQLAINDWKNSDARQRTAILAALKWWREDFPKLCQVNHQPGGQTSSELERIRQAT